MKYVSDIVGDNYKKWTGSKLIVINTPTGSGKTTFILKTLLQYAKENNLKITYFVNRVALRKQLQYKIDSEYIQYKDYIAVVSYQSMAKFKFNSFSEYEIDDDINNGTKKHITESDYFIFDETHYFLSDSSFNEEIEQCLLNFFTLESIAKKNAKSIIKIFMTATVPYLFLALGNFDRTIQSIGYNYIKGKGFISISSAYKGLSNTPDWIYQRFIENSTENIYDIHNAYIPDNHPSFIRITRYKNGENKFRLIQQMYTDNFNEIIGKCEYYDTKPDYSYIIPVYFDSNDDIIDTIVSTKSNTDDKWIIFVDNIKDGEIMNEALNNEGITSVFITSKKKTYTNFSSKAAFREISKNERFAQRVLITTQVLDNGINLHDPNIKNIVIKCTDKTTFIQMLGRRRRTFDPDEKINLYIQNISEITIRKKFISKYMRTFIFILRFIYFKENNSDVFEKNRFVKYTFTDFKNEYMHNGHFVSPYKHYIYGDFYDDTINYPDNQDHKESKMQKFLKMYNINGFAVNKFLYDFIEALVLLEKAQGERYEKLRKIYFDEFDINTNNLYDILWDSSVKWYDEIIEKYKEIALEIEATQYVWIREQLSWIDIEWKDENDPLHPVNPDHWIKEYSGIRKRTQNALLNFLDNNKGWLDEGDEKELKRLYRAFIKSVHPKHKHYNSKGSKSIINQDLKEFGIEYHIESVKKCVNGKQRNWWYIEEGMLSE